MPRPTHPSRTVAVAATVLVSALAAWGLPPASTADDAQPARAGQVVRVEEPRDDATGSSARARRQVDFRVQRYLVETDPRTGDRKFIVEVDPASTPIRPRETRTMWVRAEIVPGPAGIERSLTFLASQRGRRTTTADLYVEGPRGRAEPCTGPRVSARFETYRYRITFPVRCLPGGRVRLTDISGVVRTSGPAGDAVDYLTDLPAYPPPAR